jgi:hypothetical protein
LTHNLAFYLKRNLYFFYTALILTSGNDYVVVVIDRSEMEDNIFTNLPVDVFERIMKHLPLKDYVGLRAICRSFRKTVSHAIEKKCCCHLPELPILSTKRVSSVESWFWRNNKSMLRSTDECLGSVDGWLIVSDNSEEGFAKIFFLNPVTDVRFTIPSKLCLPPISSIIGARKLSVRKMVASSTPNWDGSDCYLVVLLSDYCHIAIYKLFEKSWTIVEPDKDSGIYFEDIEIIGTKLYVNDPSSDFILVYDLKDSTNGPPKAEMLAELPRIGQSGSSIIGSFLAKDKTLKELYFIRMFYNAEVHIRHVFSERFIVPAAFAKPPKVTSFEVFKLDRNKSPIGWQNVKLEDRVAFVSKLKSMVMKRDEFGYNKELIRGNSIYFAVTFHCPRKNPPESLELGRFV